MKITELAIKNKVVTLTIVILAFIGGIFSYFSMPKAEDPGFTIRSAIVVTYFPGASPKRVEELVTDKIEEAVSEIPEIKEVKSTSKNGFSMVTVEVSNKYYDLQQN
jgi:multidrug efflux pump subunit AcrB